MKFIAALNNIRSKNPQYNNELWRNSEGRLVIKTPSGDTIDLFDLVLWIEQNPLAQFRGLPLDEEDAKPHHLFTHMFDEKGNLPA